jgi:hypothetical protein
MEYNTKQPLILKEYGRNVQKLVRYIANLDNIEDRTKMAHVLINLMKQVNPAVKENSDNNQRIWDHLYVMADFKLDINGPYPKPDRSILVNKPRKMEYSTSIPKYRHYGKNIELLIERVNEVTDPQEKMKAIIYVARLMKSFYGAWNKENISDEVIADQLYEMSGKSIDIRQKVRSGELSLDVAPIKEKSPVPMGKQPNGNTHNPPSNFQNQGNQKRKGPKKRR